MKVPNIRARTGQLEIQMTPMIDMVFLLIVFFVWTSGMQAVEYILPSQMADQTGTLPSAATEIPPAEADFDPVVVRLAGSGSAVQWFVNDELVSDLTALQLILEKLASLKPDAPLIVHPEPTISLGPVIDVYDLALRLGFQKVQFAASDEENE